MHPIHVHDVASIRVEEIRHDAERNRLARVARSQRSSLADRLGRRLVLALARRFGLGEQVGRSASVAGRTRIGAPVGGAGLRASC